MNHATETFVTEAVAAEAEIARAAEKTNKEAIEAEAKTARAAEKENKDAIAAIKDDANIDSFADVVVELAKKQNNLTAEVDYATPGQVSTAKSEATKYTDDKIGNIDTNTVKDYVDKVNTSLTNHITNEYNVLAGTVAGHTTSINKNTTDIAALVTKVAIEEGKVGTLETAVAGKVDQTTYDVLAQ